MRYLFGMFIFSYGCHAYAEIGPDQAATVLEKALTIASGVPGVIGAIIVAVIMVAYAMICLWRAIDSIASYFKAKKIREEETYKAYQATKLQQREDQLKREKDNYEAYMAIIEQAYLIKMNKMVELIKAGNLKDVLLMVPDNLKDKALDVLYDSTTTAEYRSTEIIKLIRGK